MMRHFALASVQICCLAMLTACAAANDTCETCVCDTGTCVDDTNNPPVVDGTLLGIAYNYTTQHNELRAIDLATAEVTTLTSFDFDSGHWFYQLAADPDAGVLYAISSADTLYSIAMDGSAVTAIGTLTQPVHALGLGQNGLIAVSYNEQTDQSELRSVDTTTAEVTTLTTIDIDSTWFTHFATDRDNGVIYLFSDVGTLYRIAMDGSDVTVIGTLSQSMQIMDLGDDGLIGVAYNEMTQHNELRSVDPETATVTTLTSFDFDTGHWNFIFVTDLEARFVYALSSGNTLVRLSMDGSAVETVGQLTQPVQVFVKGPD